MRVELFDFNLPEEAIAVRPVTPRDSAKMLVVGSAIADNTVRNLPDFLRAGDVLVLNDTRVFPARLCGVRGEAKVEVLLHKRHGGLWTCFAKPAKRLKVGDVLTFAPAFSARVSEKLESGEVVLDFGISDSELMQQLEEHGQIPLPPYIEKKRAVDARDARDYQTTYADAAKTRSIAAPTAGLHFTPALFAALGKLGVACAHVTLHVGAGTFLPVKAEDTGEHKMHSEWAEISAETAALINARKQAGGRVIAVGTTSLRTLETATDAEGKVHPFSGETDIFITPGYAFKCVELLLTNFHLPKSTLFMLVSAFSGLDTMQAAYAHAISNGYRFYSYGDACLLYRGSYDTV